MPIGVISITSGSRQYQIEKKKSFRVFLTFYDSTLEIQMNRFQFDIDELLYELMIFPIKFLCMPESHKTMLRVVTYDSSSECFDGKACNSKMMREHKKKRSRPRWI